MSAGSGTPAKPLDEVATIERESVSAGAITRGTLYVGLEHIESDGAFIDVKPVEAGELASNKFRFGPRHILYGKLRPYLKKTARPDFEGVCSTDILPILPGPEMDRDYLFHYLRQPKVVEQAVRRCTGANLPRLSPRALASFSVPVPPLPEQRRIAVILDKADAIRVHRKVAIGLAEELLRSAFLDLFGDPVTNSRGWDTQRLDSIAAVNRGRFSPRPRNDPRFYGGDHPFVQTGDVAAAPDYLTTWKQTLNDSGTTVSRSFPVGSVLVAIVGATIGESAVLAFESYCPDSVVGIVPRAPYTGEFIEYLLRFWKQRFRDEAPETARANINLETLRPVPVPVVSEDSLQRFSVVYRKVAAWTDRKLLSPYQELLDSLTNELLAPSERERSKELRA